MVVCGFKEFPTQSESKQEWSIRVFLFSLYIYCPCLSYHHNHILSIPLSLFHPITNCVSTKFALYTFAIALNKFICSAWFPIEENIHGKMSQAPVSCLPVSSKMSKAKKVLDEARETHNKELDLVEKGIVSFDEMPGLCKYILLY